MISDVQHSLKEQSLIFFAPEELNEFQLIKIANESTRLRIRNNETSNYTFGFIGTVRWLGTLPNQTGDWVCVEWDESPRGKNNGHYKEDCIVKPLLQFRRYRKHLGCQFDTSTSLSASDLCCSFLRLSKAAPHAYPGVSLLDAIQWRYQKNNQASSMQDMVLENDTTGVKKTIVFEGLDEARVHFHNIARLKFIEVDATIVSRIGETDQWLALMGNTPATESLVIDSAQMALEWSDVVRLYELLPKLTKLALPHCWRLGCISPTRPFECKTKVIREIETLDLTGIPLTWELANSILGVFEGGVSELILTGCGLGPLPCRLEHLKHTEKLQLDMNEALFERDFNANFFTDQAPNCTSLFLHHTGFRSFCLSSTTPVLGVEELGLDGTPIDTWHQLFLLSLVFPNLTKLTMVGVPLQKSSSKDLPEEHLWSTEHHWRTNRESVLLLMIGVAFPKLVLFNFKQIDGHVREEAFKYYIALTNRNHPIVPIIQTVMTEIETCSEVVELRKYMSQATQGDQDGQSPSKLKPKTLHVLIEPDLGNMDEWAVIPSPFKMRIPRDISIGQLLELYMRKQLPDIRSKTGTLSIYLRDEKESAMVEPSLMVGDWLTHHNVLEPSSEFVVALQVAPAEQDKEDFKRSASGIRASKPNQLMN